MKDTTFELNGKKYKMDFSNDEKIWRGEIDFKDRILDLEIESTKDFEWSELNNLFSMLKNNYFEKIIENSEKLLLNYIDVLRWVINENDNISNYSFRLLGIYYRGKINDLIFSDMAYDYSLFFELQSSNSDYEDPYGTYYIDLSNAYIRGLRREQV